ncbi:hypothetical protein SCUCBS95973_003421 [Sporothrix curviconia]|uniref:Zn(2)-C6 fungal-type domain-containing protein n=1 Tax=Sporothrix curviconia TaxID=1260050 RepID=A0ABP0BFI9_9PEZI
MQPYQSPRLNGRAGAGSGWFTPSTPSSARSARSREGCLTCKRRKVKCDEQRPRCSHCERLNMECKWRPIVASATATNTATSFAGNGSNGSNANGGGGGGGDANGMQRQLQLPDRPMQAYMPTLEQRPSYDGSGVGESSAGPSSTRNGSGSSHGRSLSTSVTASTTASSPRLLMAAGSTAAAQNHQLHRQQNPSQQQQQQQQQAPQLPQPPHAVNQVFDFASFMWDADDVWSDVRHQIGVGGLIADMGVDVPGLTGAAFPSSTANDAHGSNGTLLQEQQQQQQQQQQQHQAHNGVDTQMNESTHGGLSVSPQAHIGEAPAAENYRLMDYFIHAVTPPILAEVETQKKWLVMRRVLVSRANASSMVRWAILAFSNFMLVQREGAWMASRQNHYENALAEVMAAIDMAATAAVLLDGSSQQRGSTNGTGNGSGGGGTTGNTGDNGPGTTGTTSSTTAAATGPTSGSNAAERSQTVPNHAVTNFTYAAAGVAAPNDSNGSHGQNSSKLQGRFLTGSVQARAPAAQPVLSLSRSSGHRENLLATLFFLSYVDILEGRIEAAHANLKRAHDILQSSEKGGKFSAVERQFLLWLRLLDARAVSAGGEGLFLSTDDERLLVETPPAGALEAELGQFGGEGNAAGGNHSNGGGPVGGHTIGSTNGSMTTPTGIEAPHDDIEDVLFQILYQPGILFFQKVQSFMGRISRIDPWHRSRGTVEDEIDVMNIGAAIAADLRTLYDNRPMLMDYAVAGKLTAAHVSAQLAFAVTRSFRTYLCNYYASKVHLHRVAYKTLPLTQEATEALAQIRHLARQLVEALDAEDALPANMLWPLLMLGSEEPDPVERAWIHTQIMRMQKVAGNSKITAQVLAELQARQDASQARVDIRSVMHAIFNSCFAIV